MTPKTQTLMHRGLAFVAGIGFSAVPTVGPFVAVLAILSGRIQIQRVDAWWWLAALLLGAPFVVTGYVTEGLLTIAQVLAVWLIYRAATELRNNLRSHDVSTDIGAGLVVGLAITLALGLNQMSEFRFDVAITTLDAIAWSNHPAIFGHSVLTLSALLALVLPSTRLRVVSLAIGALGVILSGSLEAVWAWLIIAIGLRFVGRRGSRGIQVAEWTLVAIMLFVVSGLAGTLGLGRTGFLTDFVPQGEERNLFRGTEVAEGDWWYPLGVQFAGERVTIDDLDLESYVVTKTWQEPWSRLQQAVTLIPGETYTLSALIQAPDAVRTGFDGWGRASDDGEPANLATVLEGESHRATSTGPIAIIASSVVNVDELWRRLFVTFRFDGEAPLTWYVGVVPDRSNQQGATIRMAELQLTASYSLLPYRPGPAERGVMDLRTSRFPIWRDALDAIGVRPLFGWGPQGFPRAVEEVHPDETLLRPIASHAHNALLAAWVDRGLLGALGLLGLFALIGVRAVQQRDRAAAIVLLGVAILNMFDSTLLSGSVVYPLAAVMGWRAVGHREAASAETGVGSSLAVRLALAMSDTVAGAISLTAGLVFTSRFDPSLSVTDGWSWPLVYATLIWPAVAAASRLYPGYGRPSYQELSYSVRAAVGAGILVGFIALLVPDVFGLTAPVFLVAVGVGAVLMPSFRALTKLALQRLRLWGRPVVVLGTEESAARVTRHLLGHPGIGLHPVAVFGDPAQDTPHDSESPRPEAWTVKALPVTGTLDQAWAYIHRYGIRHAIVTRDAAKSAAFDQVLLRSGTQLQYVQYLPDLRGLPTNSVVATPLGSALALEARNQLASGANRAIKRVIDFLGSVVLLAVLGLPLLMIALLIRLDSPGPALYLSPRIGRYGREFDCIKFRTMYVDADERLEELLAERPELRAEYERFHKLEDDPRVTRVGRLLRRVSLDELPQLLNVLVGQMSLVGPRPYMVRELEIMGQERDLIFLARPGMTGYWQVEARNDVTFEERQTMEAHYVRNWSVWWDIDILLRTPGVMVGKTGK